MKATALKTVDSPILLSEVKSGKAPVVIIKKSPLFPFDKGKALEIILTAYKAYEMKQKLFSMFNASTAPQNIYRPGMEIPLQSNFFKETIERKKINVGDPDHVRWLWPATGTDRRQVSEEVYRAHVMIHSQYPEFYEKDVLKLDVEWFGKFLSQYKVGVPRDSAKYWIRSAKTLFDEFDGDPINIIKHCGGTVDKVQAYKKLMEKKNGSDPLPGYGPKITSLFLLFMAELGVYPMPEDAFPVDVHVQRFFLQQGLIVPRKDIANDGLETELRPYLSGICNDLGLNKVTMSHTLWTLGAKGCSGCSKKKSIHLMCPVRDTCKGCVNSESYFKVGTWPKNLQFMRKGSDREFILPNGLLFQTP